MSDIAKLTSQPVPLYETIFDEKGNPTGEVREHLVYPLTIDEIGQLQDWVDRQFPDPIQRTQESIDQARAREKPFTVAQEQFLFKAAQELAMRSKYLIGTPEADQLILSVEGTKQLLKASIRKGNPAFTEDDADRLFKGITAADVIRLYDASQINFVISDPKVEMLDVRPISKPSGGTMSRRQRRARKV